MRALMRAHVAGSAFVLLTVAATSAHAVLGGDVASIQADQLRAHGVRRQALAVKPQVQMHEIALADGSSVRQYVTPSGIVFAVSWSTHFKPRLDTLLGQHAASYAAAARDAMKTPGIKRNVRLQRGDLVVHAAAHLNAYVGVAYLRSLVPSGVDVHALR